MRWCMYSCLISAFDFLPSFYFTFSSPKWVSIVLSFSVADSSSFSKVFVSFYCIHFSTIKNYKTTNSLFSSNLEFSFSLFTYSPSHRNIVIALGSTFLNWLDKSSKWDQLLCFLFFLLWVLFLTMYLIKILIYNVRVAYSQFSKFMVVVDFFTMYFITCFLVLVWCCFDL